MTTALLIDSMAVMGSPSHCDYCRFLAATSFKVSRCGITNPSRAVCISSVLLGFFQGTLIGCIRKYTYSIINIVCCLATWLIHNNWTFTFSHIRITNTVCTLIHSLSLSHSAECICEETRGQNKNNLHGRTFKSRKFKVGKISQVLCID